MRQEGFADGTCAKAARKGAPPMARVLSGGACAVRATRGPQKLENWPRRTCDLFARKLAQAVYAINTMV